MVRKDAATPPRDGLEADLGWGLRALSIAFQAHGGDAVSAIPGGARGYLTLLAAGAEPARSQLAIARSLGVDKTAMTYLIDTLVAKGLVERKLNPRDRRVRFVVLTDKGAEALREAREKLQATEDRLLAPLNAAQRASFRAMLRTVAAASQGTTEGCGSE